MLSKFFAKPAQKQPIFSIKANYSKDLIFLHVRDCEIVNKGPKRKPREFLLKRQVFSIDSHRFGKTDSPPDFFVKRAACTLMKQTFVLFGF